MAVTEQELLARIDEVRNEIKRLKEERMQLVERVRLLRRERRELVERARQLREEIRRLREERRKLVEKVRELRRDRRETMQKIREVLARLEQQRRVVNELKPYARKSVTALRARIEELENATSTAVTAEDRMAMGLST